MKATGTYSAQVCEDITEFFSEQTTEALCYPLPDENLSPLPTTEPR